MSSLKEAPVTPTKNERASCETKLSATLLSFIECEVEQEKRTAVSSPTQREADEEQNRKEEEGRKKLLAL